MRRKSPLFGMLGFMLMYLCCMVYAPPSFAKLQNKQIEAQGIQVSVQNVSQVSSYQALSQRIQQVARFDYFNITKQTRFRRGSFLVVCNDSCACYNLYQGNSSSKTKARYKHKYHKGVAQRIMVIQRVWYTYLSGHQDKVTDKNIKHATRHKDPGWLA